LTVRSDEVRTTDGFVLQGTVIAMDAKQLTLKTVPFGNLSVPRTSITGLTIENPASFRLDDESVQVGVLKNSGTNQVEISGKSGNTLIAMDRVKEVWPQGTEDPRVVALKAEAKEKKRRWKVDLIASGKRKSGNTQEKKLFGNVNAVLNGPTDELKLYSRYSHNSVKGRTTADETIGGLRYSVYTYARLGWYVRTELEKDPFENIQLRDTMAGGSSYRWANRKDYKLSGGIGVSYRHERYDNGSADTANLGGDFGLSHFYRFKNRWETQNELAWTPSIEDFNDYLATQDSSLSIPVGSSEWWKIRLGLRNEYNNRPDDERKKIDSTLYAAMVITRK
jgi:putative salt-induced outer membrane protein YdiY